MAKVMKEPDTGFGKRMREHRKAARLSTIEAAYSIRELLPPSEWKSYQAIHRLEVGETAETDASPALLAALAKVYDVPLAELSPVAAESRQRLLSLFLDETLGHGSKKPGSRTPRNRTEIGRAHV